MIEHPIRPRERLVKYAELRKQDLAEFHRQFQHEQNQQYRDCPACGEDDDRADFSKDGFNFCRCRNCECLYVNPVPTEALLGRYYDGSQSMEYFHREVLVPTLDTRREIIRERLKRMEPFVDGNDCILEVGSSIGLFVEAALEKGWNPTAVEINTELVRYLQRHFEIPVYQGFFERLDDLPNNQDVVVMWEVIEHLRDPELALRKAHAVLGDGGRLILTLPNVDGLEFQLIGPDHELIEAPGHLNYFSITTLEKLLSRTGFEIVHYETPGILDLVNIMNAIQAGDDSGIGGRFLTSLAEFASDEEWDAINQAVTTAIQRACLSGNMFVVAGKRAAVGAAANRACA